MDESVFQSRLRAGVGGPDLWNLRKETALHTARSFSEVGRAMAGRTDVTGDDGEAVRAMGTLLQMAGELGFAAGRMLSGRSITPVPLSCDRSSRSSTSRGRSRRDTQA